jgi:hypothetical protein
MRQMLECYKWQRQQQAMDINQDLMTRLVMKAGRQKRGRVKLTEHI